SPTASEAHGLASSIRWHSARPGGFGGLDAVGVDAIVRRRFATARLDVPARLWNRIDWRNASHEYRDEPAARISTGAFRTDQYTHSLNCRNWERGVWSLLRRPAVRAASPFNSSNSGNVRTPEALRSRYDSFP